MLLYEDHHAAVYSLAFSPDGTALASAARDGAVCVREMSGRLSILVERGPQTAPIYAVVYGPDGAVVVGGVFGWQTVPAAAARAAVDGAGPRMRLTPSMAPVTALALLDEQTLAVGRGNRVKATAGKFELWDLRTGRRREPTFYEPTGVRAVATCPGKHLVAWSTGHCKVCVWNTLRPDTVEYPLPKTGPSLALSPDGSLLAVAVDYSVRVYSVERRQPRWELRGHRGQVSAVAFSPDGGTLASGSWDRSVRLWDAATGRERCSFHWPIGRVYSLAFAPDGSRMAAGDDLGRVVLWDLE